MNKEIEAKIGNNIRRLREFIEYVYDHPALETSLAACGDGLTISVVKEI